MQVRWRLGESMRFVRHESGSPTPWAIVALWGLLAMLLTVAFAMVPMAGGDDWATFRGAAQRILTGAPLYGQRVTVSYYSNPPWVALILTPLAILPAKWGWAALNSLNLIALVFLTRRWNSGLIKLVLVLSSPATFYILLHGQIEPLVLTFLLLPKTWWPLAALTKPQIGLGMAFGVPRRKILGAVALAGGVLALSLLLFGNWPGALLSQPSPFVEGAHNLWLGLWPFQLPAGLILILLGIRRADERLLVSAGPFASPYATTSSLIGPWMAVLSFLKDWEAGLVWLAWWGATAYRMFGL